jgi:hypothetical protein
MNRDKKPYVGNCGFCEQGLLKFRRCPACQTVCAVCDECELVWTKIADVSRDRRTKADGAFPICPACGAERKRWSKLDARQLRRLGFADFIGGESV